MEINIKHDLDKLQKTLNGMGKRVFKPAINSSLNRVGNKATNAAQLEVAEVQRVSVHKIKARTKITKSTFKTLRFRAAINFRGITWASLGAKVIGGKNRPKKRQKGIRAGLAKNKHIHRHAFLGKGRGGQQLVFVRQGKERKPLRVLRVRLFEPFNRALAKQDKKARQDFLETVRKELEWRVPREIQKNANRK